MGDVIPIYSQMPLPAPPLKSLALLAELGSA
jgi:hypothetical protein